jgi:hypothetical protein
MATPNVVFTLSDFTVEVSGSGYKVQLSPNYEGTTDSDGVVTFSSVTPGIYTLNVPGAGVPSLRVTVPNATGPYNAIDIVNDGQGWLAPGGSPEGRVVGKPQDRYYDPVNNADYVKATGSGTTGWQKLVALASVFALVAYSLIAADPQIGDTSVQPSLTQNSNVTVSNITAKGHLSLSGATNRLTVADGSLKLDGSAITGGASGDPFVVTSELANNETNVAMVLNTENYWDLAKILKVNNGGTNVLFFGPNGEIGIGRGVEEYWGDPINSGETLYCIRDTTAGDPDKFDIYLGATDGNNDSSGYISGSSSGTTISAGSSGSGSYQVQIEANTVSDHAKLTFLKTASAIARLEPTAPNGGNTPWWFGSSESRNSGNLVEVSNAGTTKATVDYRGALMVQAGTGITPASASATGTAGTIVWDANFIYVCVATDTWKRVAISTW